MAKRSNKQQTSKNGAPKGFRKVEMSLAGFWKPEGEGESIQGIVGNAIDMTGADGRANQFYTLRLTSEDASSILDVDDNEVTPKSGMVIGVGGKMLLTFLQERIGSEVCLVYKGLGKAKPRQSPPKLYDMYERAGE